MQIVMRHLAAVWLMLIAHFLVLTPLSGGDLPRVIATDSTKGFSVRTADGLELLVRVFSTRPIVAAPVGAAPDDHLSEIWIVNRGDFPKRVIAGPILNLRMTPDGLLMTYMPRRAPIPEGALVRDRPSELEVVCLKKDEAVRVGDVGFALADMLNLFGEELPVVYRIHPRATELYEVWSGEVGMRCMLPVREEVQRALEEKKAEPGATDNPDDAQRVREDH